MKRNINKSLTILLFGLIMAGQIRAQTYGIGIQSGVFSLNPATYSNFHYEETDNGIGMRSGITFTFHKNRWNFHLTPSLGLHWAKGRIDGSAATNIITDISVNTRTYGLRVAAGKRWIWSPRITTEAGLGLGMERLVRLRYEEVYTFTGPSNMPVPFVSELAASDMSSANLLDLGIYGRIYYHHPRREKGPLNFFLQTRIGMYFVQPKIIAAAPDPASQVSLEFALGFIHYFHKK